MKIGIEAQRIFRKKKHGMDMVVLELIKNLQKIDIFNEYIIYIHPDEDICINETSNFKIRYLSSGFYPYWEQIQLWKAAKEDKLDILHCTSNTAPILGNTKLVVTLHDIIYLENNSLKNTQMTAYQKFGNLYRRMVVPRILKKSAKIITVSNFEKQRIQETLTLEANQLVAIYNGVGAHFIPITDEYQLQNIRKKYQLPKEYIFFLGNTDPKKNVPNVLKAYFQYTQKNINALPLLVTDFNQDSLTRTLAELNLIDLKEKIFLTGYVNNTDLPAIYSMSKLFLYPSKRESFGIPMLEAMRCNVPVITSNTSSMPEIAGDAALLIDPENVQEIETAIETVLNNNELRTQLTLKGLQRAYMFSWENMAKEVLELYNTIK